MAHNTNPNSDVLQSHEHQKLTAEEIAKAVARHNKAHPKGAKNPADQSVKSEQKKSGKK